MLRPVASTAFKRDAKRAKKRSRDMAKLKRLVALLCAGEPLPARHRDHPLKGDWRGFRDAHIEPDWLLIYCVEDEELQLARTGTHADLFGE